MRTLIHIDNPLLLEPKAYAAVSRFGPQRGMFPPAAPLGDNVDSRFLACTGDQVIGMAEIVQAMARHQQKQGSPAAVSGFRQYHGMVQRA